MSFDWWQNLYEDAERIGLKITSFELDLGKYAEGEFTGDEWGVDCAKAILEEHGADCATFKRAAEFMAHYVLAAACCDPDGPSQAQDEDAAEQAEQFLKDILKCYADMLQSEYEYLSSYEAAEESIRANDYKFDEDGNMI